MKDLSKIEEIYHAALEFAPDERELFLKEACAGDFRLHQEVKSLLDFAEKAKDFIETPPGDIAAALINSKKEKDLSGKVFGHYCLLSPLGKGGMGEVYLAEDTELGRKIALKLLPVQFSANSERKLRFEQEARAVSALNHPNIITIHGIEKSGEFNFIATEYIEGETLKEKIAHEKMSWPETIKIAIQMASALESAHAVGIVHRDIKPANIMIRRDGLVKVLDFGLAKLVESRESRVESEEQWGMGSGESGLMGKERGSEEKRGVRSEGWRSKEQRREADQDSTLELPARSSLPTPHSLLPTNLTDFGTVMGTINYMSPEQALGKKIDSRTDIFSLGVVLYEMISGEQPFKGSSESAIYNATINQNPTSLKELKPEIPLALDQIAKRALEKKPENRYQTISELRSDLEKLKENPSLSASNFIAFQSKSSWLSSLWPVAVGVLILTGLYFAFLRPTADQPSESKNFNYTQLTSHSGEEISPSLSPDGKSFIYASRESGNWDIYLKQIGENTAINLTKELLSDEIQGVFSPDGGQIAFRSEQGGGGIFVMNSNGENVKQITNLGFYPNWSPDGQEIVFGIDDFNEPGSRTTVPSQLWKVKVETGEKSLITEQDAVQPSWSPNGKRIAFWGINSGGQRDVWTISAVGGEPVVVTADSYIDWNPVWSTDGKFLYFVSNRSGSMNLWRVAIDENSGKVSGHPEPITIPSNYSQLFNFSRDGKGFVYVQTVNYSNIFKVDFDTNTETVGKTSVEVTKGSKIATNPEISADNQFITFDAIGDKQEDVFVTKADGGEIKQLTNDIYKDRAPHWSPDGKRIAFFTDETGKYEGYVMNSDGSRRKMVTKFPAGSWSQLPVWSPDGKRLIFNTRNGYPAIFDPDKEGKDQTPQYLPDEGNPKRWFMAFSWSSDGKKLIGYGRDTEKPESYLMTFDFTADKYETVSDFGTRALWLADNKRAVFYHNDKIYLLDTETKGRKELLSVAPNRLQSISLSQDNRSIYYTLQKSESDIWLANFQ